MTPSIIFDFDGTLAIGHGPVLAYARLVAAAAGPKFVEHVDAELARYDAGTTDYRDGYNIVAALAEAQGVTAEQRAEAYTRSREQLGTDEAPVASMPGLDSFLATLSRKANLVLATNAPQQGVDRVLNSWGVEGAFDAQHFNVGKPSGLRVIVERALEHGPVLAVGDIVEYDLAPAMALGADTALVGATASTSTAKVTMRGESLETLTAAIHTWAATAVEHATTPHSLSTER